MNKEQQRLPFWTDLMNIARTMSSVWCVIDDFNAALYKHDRIGGDEVTTHDTSELSTLLEHSELHELRSMGAYYSWTNKQVWSRIDRAFINDHWCGTFDYTHSLYRANGLSNHAPILLQFPNAPKPQIRLSYYDMWSTHPAFRDIIASKLPIAPLHTLETLCKLLKQLQPLLLSLIHI